MTDKPKSTDLRKMAMELRKKAGEIRAEKMVKSAKFVVGLTALMQLKDKMVRRNNG